MNRQPPPFLGHLVEFFEGCKFVLLIFQKYAQNFFYLQLEKFAQEGREFETDQELYTALMEAIAADPRMITLCENLLKVNHPEVHAIKGIFTQAGLPEMQIPRMLAMGVAKSTHLKRVARTCKVILHVSENQDQAVTEALLASFEKQQALLNNQSKVNNFYNLELVTELELTSLPFVFHNKRIFRTVQGLDPVTWEYLANHNAIVEFEPAQGEGRPILRLMYITVDSTHAMIERFVEANFVPSTLHAHLEFYAYHQSRGIGRNAKAWSTSMISDIATTYTIGADQVAPQVQDKISLVLGNVLHQTLKDQLGDQVNLQIKWPNDIYLDGSKLAGILITKSRDTFIISFGMNVLVKHPEIVARLDRKVESIYSPEKSAKATNQEILEFGDKFTKDVYFRLAQTLSKGEFDRDYYQSNNYFGADEKLLLTDTTGERVYARFDSFDENGFLVIHFEDKNEKKTINVPNISIEKR